MTRSLDAEVGVVGVGTVGSLLLWQLAGRGTSAIGFERHAPGHDRGAVGGETRLFRMAYAEGAQYAGLLRDSLTGWRRLQDEAGAALLVQCGGLSIGDAGGTYIGDLLVSARAAGTAVEVLDRVAAQARYPQHRLLEGEVAVLDPAAGFVRSESAVLAATVLAERSGASVRRHTGVDAVLDRGDHVEIHAGADVVRVRDAVLCAGSWTPQLLPAAWSPLLQPRRVRLSWFAARDPARFAPDRFPVFIRETGDRHIYGAPSIDGVSVKVAGLAGSVAVPDPSELERRHSTEELSAMAAVVADLLPGLHPDPVRADAYTDLFTADGTPVVGRVPGSPRVIVASGFSGRGFKYAPALAAGLADMLLGDVAPPAFMSPRRAPFGSGSGPRG